jgi:hypothetical protein
MYRVCMTSPGVVSMGVFSMEVYVSTAIDIRTTYRACMPEM